ncbi:helix-turn-helix domain-containing protein [Microbacterium capsulatum]|uniref:Helix-turn-helix domain-containing protein n=1 Tax=Microbacterium capsulatum TaxID=3041921 RepID=A0ABU0XDV3_9MICO|nr:helix-turn-helix domain-containing protein [Microbacterium sp. ASV81]MDQ4212899.1 helix-turn-helix domain-containing protein [Microbacterium sp. ASV81]
MVYGLTAGRAPLTEDELDAVFGALAHPVRRAVLHEVASPDRPEAMTDLAERLDLSPQALNKHLSTLERAHLITRVKHGRATSAQANPEVLDSAKDWIVTMTDYWNAQLDSLQLYIDSLRKPTEDRN